MPRNYVRQNEYFCDEYVIKALRFLCNKKYRAYTVTEIRVKVNQLRNKDIAAREDGYTGTVEYSYSNVRRAVYRLLEEGFLFEYRPKKFIINSEDFRREGIRKRIINEVDFENTTIFSISKNIIAIKPVDASDKTKELFKSFLGSMCFSVLLVDDILLFMLVTNKEGTNELIAELQELIDEAAEETKLRYRAVSCVESTQPFKVSKEKKQQRRRQARINAALQEELE